MGVTSPSAQSVLSMCVCHSPVFNVVAVSSLPFVWEEVWGGACQTAHARLRVLSSSACKPLKVCLPLVGYTDRHCYPVFVTRLYGNVCMVFHRMCFTCTTRQCNNMPCYRNQPPTRMHQVLLGSICLVVASASVARQTCRNDPTPNLQQP